MATKEKMHDRFVIPPQGSVTSIGTSLNFLGQGFTVLVQLGDVSAEIRRHYDVLWQGAERLGIAGDLPPDGDAASEPPAARGTSADGTAASKRKAR